MTYTFTKVECGKFTTGTVKTMDEQVVSATPSFAWAVGKHIASVVGWAEGKGFTVKISE